MDRVNPRVAIGPGDLVQVEHVIEAARGGRLQRVDIAGFHLGDIVENHRVAAGERRDIGVTGGSHVVLESHPELLFARLDPDRDRVGIDERAPAAAIAEIIGGNLHAGVADEARRGGEDHALERGVDIGNAAAEGHRRIGRTVARAEAEPGRLLQVEGAVGRYQRNLDAIHAGVEITDRDRLAGG